jgi:hypothetical protein
MKKYILPAAGIVLGITILVFAITLKPESEWHPVSELPEWVYEVEDTFEIIPISDTPKAVIDNEWSIMWHYLGDGTIEIWSNWWSLRGNAYCKQTVRKE